MSHHSPDSIGPDQGAIDRAIFRALIENIPSDWRSASLNVYCWQFVPHEGSGPQQQIIGPDGQEGKVPLSEVLLKAIEQLRHLHAKFKPSWQIAEYGLRKDDDGQWRYECGRIEFSGGGGE